VCVSVRACACVCVCVCVRVCVCVCVRTDLSVLLFAKAPLYSLLPTCQKWHGRVKDPSTSRWPGRSAHCAKRPELPIHCASYWLGPLAHSVLLYVPVDL
jgi:hypothetical protein